MSDAASDSDYAGYGEILEYQAVRIAELESILDALCDWAQHVAAPDDDPIRFIVERAEEALKVGK